VNEIFNTKMFELDK